MGVLKIDRLNASCYMSAMTPNCRLLTVHGATETVPLGEIGRVQLWDRVTTGLRGRLCSANYRWASTLSKQTWLLVWTSAVDQLVNHYVHSNRRRWFKPGQMAAPSSPVS